MIIIIHENSGQKYIAVGPADGTADGVGGEASGHAAGGLVHRGEVDLENKGDRSEGAVCQKKSIATRNLKSKIERSLKA